MPPDPQRREPRRHHLPILLGPFRALRSLSRRSALQLSHPLGRLHLPLHCPFGRMGGRDRDRTCVWQVEWDERWEWRWDSSIETAEWGGEDRRTVGK